MKTIQFLLLLIPLVACQAQVSPLDEPIVELPPVTENTTKDSAALQAFYQLNQGDDKPSVATGNVGAGTLVNGKLMPFYGQNFQYFDADSYLGYRAFTSDAVCKTILGAYSDLDQAVPNRKFYLMELSNKEGGKIMPHRTHQNGRSADFLLPKLRYGIPYTALDTLGKNHYLLNFNDNGEYSEDPTIKIDFDLVAQHILLLNENARKNNLKIAKVIIKIEFKDELFTSPHGQALKRSGIYVVQSLSPMVNALHDDQFHMDFEPLGKK